MKLAVVGGGDLAARVALRALGGGTTVHGVGGPLPPARWPDACPWGPELPADDLAASIGDADALVVLGGDGEDRCGPDQVRRVVDSVARGAVSCRRLIYWGTHRVYAPTVDPGAPRTEDAPLVEDGIHGEWAVLDRRIATLRGRRELEVVLFRAVPVLGHGIDGWVRRLRELPVVAVPGGADPLQVLHADDALDILWRACNAGHPGVYNAASDGLLFRSRVARALGRVPLPVPRRLAAVLLAPGRLVGRPPALGPALVEAYETVVVDNGRLKTHFGYRPRRTARMALQEAVREA